MPGARSAAEPLEPLEERLGYRFRRRVLLELALTHRSRRAAPADAMSADNERLEFLGDAIVGFLVSDRLFAACPGLPEGKLSRIRANLVNAAHLRRVAERLELGRFLRLGAGEEKTGGRQKQALLANAVEAVVAAVYLDGGLDPARHMVENLLMRELEATRLEPLARADFKSALQEYLQGHRLPAARYQTAGSRGPEHSKTFTIELWVGDRCLARADGASKKEAEQRAARLALERLPQEAEHELA
jgi:ribonuclease-3